MVSKMVCVVEMETKCSNVCALGQNRHKKVRKASWPHAAGDDCRDCLQEACTGSIFAFLKSDADWQENSHGGGSILKSSKGTV